MTAYQALDRALHIIDERGWTQRKPVDEAGHLCLLAAVWMATPRLGDTRREAIGMLTAVIGVNDVVVWNDRPGRKVGSVRQALLDAMSLARSEEEG